MRLLFEVELLIKSEDLPCNPLEGICFFLADHGLGILDILRGAITLLQKQLTYKFRI